MSCATGSERAILVRAVGEAVERQISFSSISSVQRKSSLSELDDSIQSWFECLFQEGQIEKARDYTFDVSEVIDLSCSRSLLAPTVAFSLSTHKDDYLFPLRDSSGMAIHTNENLVRIAALNEFAERQSLTLFWYYGHLNSTLSTLGSSNLQLPNDIKAILELLETLGSVVLFDISLFKGHHTTMAVCLGRNEPVWFAVGASAHQNLQTSMHKAIFELYQAFVLMDQLEDQARSNISDGSHDRITQGYLTFNTRETVKIFKDIIGENTHTSANKFGKIEPSLRLFDAPLLCRKSSVFLHKHSPSVTHFALHGIKAFPAMEINGHATKAERLAAERYGYHKQLRFGAIPFA